MRSPGVRFLLLPLLLFVGILMSSPPNVEMHDPSSAYHAHQSSVELPAVELAATFDYAIQVDAPALGAERPVSDGSDLGGAFLMAGSSLALGKVRRRKSSQRHRESTALNRLDKLMTMLRSSFSPFASYGGLQLRT